MPNFVPGGGSPLTLVGVDFELIATPASSGRLSEVAYSPTLDLFCTISETGSGAWNNNRIATSPSADSNSWTIRALANGTWESIAWSPTLGLFAAARSSNGGSQIATSPDGINWTIRVTPAQTVSIRRIIWGGDKFVCVGQTASDASANLGFYSTDGVTWNNISAANVSQWRDVAFSPSLGRYVAVATTGAAQRVMQSSTGISWSAVTMPSTQNWTAVEWSPGLGLFYALTGSGNVGAYSDNGTVWTDTIIDPSAQPNVWYGLSWSPLYGRFAAVSENGAGSDDRIGIGATPQAGLTIQEAPSLSAYRRINWFPEKGFWLAGGSEVGGSAIIRSCARFSTA